jgi:hypothetical protein
MKVQHFILTRFNLRLAELSEDLVRDKFGNKIDRDQWLEHRFKLFERYCLPSMAAQKNQDFRWMLFFDEATPARFREHIERLKADCPQIQAFFIRGPHIHDYVMEQVEADTSVLITTRMDNDDALHEDALQVIRDQVGNGDRDLCVNLRYGLELIDDKALELNDVKAEVISHKYNHFSSLIEVRKTRGFVTIFESSHGRISSLAPVRQIYSTPYWLVVLHDRNITNQNFAQVKFSFSAPKSLRRYFKNHLLLKLRRRFWAPQLRRKFTYPEIQKMFHIK